MLAHLIPDPSQLFLLSIDAANLVLGTLVLIKRPRRIVNQTFFVFVCGCVAWSGGISLLYITHDFIFDKLALGGGFLLYFGLTLFADVFPSKNTLSRRFFLIFIPLAIAVVCLPFNLFIQGIIVDKDGFIQPINGPLFPLFVAITVGYVTAAIYFFVRRFRGSTGNSRMQMLYFITGITLFMASLAIFDAILPALGIYRLNLIGPGASFIFVLMTSYAIVRHQLMDIRIIIQRGTIYSLLLSIIIITYVSALMITRLFFEGYEEFTDPLIDSAILIFGIITIPKIERYFQRVTNRFFFKDRYNYASAVENLSSILNTTIQMKLMVANLLQALDTIFHPESVEFFHSRSRTIFVLSGRERRAKKGVHASVPGNGYQISVTSGSRVIGVFTFGRKRSGDPYTPEDLTLLRTFATQAAVSFEKAELYEQLREYSKSLEEKVTARTRKLQEIQEGQRQLFDDMSHALQTPLTILKGAIELGKVEQFPKEARSAEVMEQSVNDLSRLIREILQLARMDEMPIENESTSFDLSRLIQNVIEYVEVVCRESDIIVISNLTPGVMMTGHEKQLEELITNLLSNAVHYTAPCPRREIRVKLAIVENSIELEIGDTGIGISAEKLPHVFERFYRSSEQDDARKTAHGLGLAIVKGIVERHRGTISVESTLSKGTRFSILFPILSPVSAVGHESATQA